MFAAGGLQGTEDGADDRAADPHEGDHDDEPPDGDGLGHVDAAAVLAATAAGDAEGRAEVGGAIRRCVAAAGGVRGVGGVVVAEEDGGAGESGPGRETKRVSLGIGTGRNPFVRFRL